MLTGHVDLVTCGVLNPSGNVGVEPLRDVVAADELPGQYG